MAPEIAAAVIGICLVFGIAFVIQRYIALRRKQKRGFYPTSADLGNALQQLQRLAQPQVRHVLQEKQREERQEDDEGGPDDPDRLIRHNSPS